MRISDWSSDVCSSDLSRKRRRLWSWAPASAGALVPALFHQPVDRVGHLDVTLGKPAGVVRLQQYLDAVVDGCPFRIMVRLLGVLGREWCRGRGCKYVWTPGVARSRNKNHRQRL